ncbi:MULTISPECIES: SDR family oxidoreductase [Derxia]|uniref:SDR family oxidoreductase n=1 Tax=Derxia gummosa DSM 723 TaxID=1121388 RepID=A0A8B6X2B2_9BURK|nr:MULTISPECIES: SDR family oxidoreductase [Derxia]
MTSPDPRTILITGASRGIGRAVAEGFLVDGWRVVLAARDQAALDAFAAEAAARGQLALPVACDVADEASVDALFERVRAECGRLDVLFNNAGVSAFASTPDELSVADWKRVVDINLTGSFLCTRAAFALMKAQSPQGGRIINNGSISAHAPRPRSVAYTATKHAITGLTKSTSLDGRPFSICAGQIDIGNAATEMAQAMARGIVQANGQVMVEPLLDVKHVVDAVRYMAGLPLGANVQNMTVLASSMPFVGRG